LVADEGVTFPVNLTVNGQGTVQQWRIPSRAECITCHTPQAGHALSFNTRQLNLVAVMNGFVGNQIDLLRTAGYFSNTPSSPNVLPRHYRPEEVGAPLESRVRSYLAVNCAYCHKAGGTAAPAAWDGRPELTLAETGLINEPASNNGGDPANRLVVPGNPVRSVALQRVAASNGFTRMPAIGSNELDAQAITMLTDWISNSLPGRKTYNDWRLEQFGSDTSPEGDPASDFDRDSRTNRQEFVQGTAPKNGGSFLQPMIAKLGANVSVSLTVPPNRSAQIEVSSDLVSWSIWDVPGNGGDPLPTGSFTLTGPLGDGSTFFRVKLSEN
jgi:mono/diheme cytochrome c family protein